MTLKEQKRWLQDRQKEKANILRESTIMVIGGIIVANAERDLEAVTAILATLDTLGTQIPLFPAQATTTEAHRA
jgi:hypothetical protein